MFLVGLSVYPGHTCLVYTDRPVITTDKLQTAKKPQSFSRCFVIAVESEDVTLANGSVVGCEGKHKHKDTYLALINFC